MAQHIPINQFKQKVFKKIEKSIVKDFKNPYIKGSLKYSYDKKLSEFYKENDNEEVYFTDRYIGKGYIYGSTRGSFEINFNKVRKKINIIYLVAWD